MIAIIFAILCSLATAFGVFDSNSILYSEPSQNLSPFGELSRKPATPNFSPTAATPVSKPNAIPAPVSDPELNEFVSTFLQATRQSENLQKTFKQTIEAIGDLDTFYLIDLDLAYNMGFSDPTKAAKDVTDSFLYAFDVLTPELLSKGVAAAVGRLLKESGKLTSANAVEISRDFANIFENLALSLGPTPAAAQYWKLVTDAILKYLTSFHILTPSVSENAANYFIQGMRSLKNNIDDKLFRSSKAISLKANEHK